MTIYNNPAKYHTVTSPKKLANCAGLSFYKHNILVEDPDPQSHASLIMLQRALHNKRNSEWLHKATRTRKRTFIKKMFEKGDVFCFKCKKKLVQSNEERQKDSNIATVDHIIPIRLNPAFARDPRNYRIACPKCNSSRNSN